MAEHGIGPIDVLVVNLYPFEATVAKEGVTRAEAIEQIDIGGVALLRAAAKNYHRVTVLTSPDQYEEFLHECRAGNGQTSLAFRRRCAHAGFALVAAYNEAISDWLGGLTGAAAPDGPIDRLTLRYGENPHQQAAFYVSPDASEPCIARAKLLGGRAIFAALGGRDQALDRCKAIPGIDLIFFGNAPFGPAPFTEDLELCRTLLDEAQPVRPDEDARQQEADDGDEADPLGDVGDEGCGDHEDAEIREQGGCGGSENGEHDGESLRRPPGSDL